LEGAVGCDRALFLACVFNHGGQRRRGGISKRGELSLATRVYCSKGSRVAGQARVAIAAPAPCNSADREERTPGTLPDHHAALYFSSPGGCAVIAASGPGQVMIIVPALNEEAAVGQVIAEVHRILPETPVLVIDDCSADSTASVARLAGAEVMSVP